MQPRFQALQVQQLQRQNVPLFLNIFLGIQSTVPTGLID